MDGRMEVIRESWRSKSGEYKGGKRRRRGEVRGYIRLFIGRINWIVDRALYVHQTEE